MNDVIPSCFKNMETEIDWCKFLMKAFVLEFKALTRFVFVCIYAEIIMVICLCHIFWDTIILQVLDNKKQHDIGINNDVVSLLYNRCKIIYVHTNKNKTNCVLFDYK